MSHFDPGLHAQLDRLIARHAHYKAAYDAIDTAVKNAGLYSDKSLLPLIGPSRSGKTRLLEDYLGGLYPPDYPSDKPRAVRRLTMPRSRRPKAFLMKLQLLVGHPYYAVGTEDAMQLRLAALFVKAGVLVLLIDELQHCVSSRGEINYDIADIFKVLLDEAKVTIIAAGLENAADVLEANEQLTGRCLQAVHLSRFDWTDPESRGEFMGVVDGFVHGLKGLKFPDPKTEDDYFRWYIASGGLVGYLHKIFRSLLGLLQKADRVKVTMDDLDAAHATAVYYRGAKLRPFDRSFDLADTITGLAYASRIGERCVEITSQKAVGRTPGARKFSRGHGQNQAARGMA